MRRSFSILKQISNKMKFIGMSSPSKTIPNKLNLRLIFGWHGDCRYWGEFDRWNVSGHLQWIPKTSQRSGHCSEAIMDNWIGEDYHYCWNYYRCRRSDEGCTNRWYAHHLSRFYYLFRMTYQSYQSFLFFFRTFVLHNGLSSDTLQ